MDVMDLTTYGLDGYRMQDDLDAQWGNHPALPRTPMVSAVVSVAGIDAWKR
jgi:hypothetical protein